MVKRLIIILIMVITACSAPKTCCGQVKKIDIKKLQWEVETGKQLKK